MKLIFGKSKWEMWDDPLESFLDRVRKSGFEATEIYLGSLHETPAEITRLHANYGLRLIGQILTIVFGMVLGVMSGFYGGTTDQIIQRTTEFISAIPEIPLFMALAAAIPQFWPQLAVYFMLTIILSFVRWGGLARQVRGMILSLREREYVLAARSAGASNSRLMFRHLLPGTMSHVIVIATLAIPGMILAETALSWLGLGIRPPLTSWGTLLQDAATVRAIHNTPWELWTVPFILLTILAYNMLGDGLRDALDPYAR